MDRDEGKYRPQLARYILQKSKTTTFVMRSIVLPVERCHQMRNIVAEI